MLPTFPLARPPDFQIFESDCKINPALVAQLKQKFFEIQSVDMETFVVDNLDVMLTQETASLYSWTGHQGYLPVMHFRTMKTLIGSLLNINIINSDHQLNCVRYFFCFQNVAKNCTIRIRKR